MRLDRYRNYYRGGIYHVFNRGNNKQDIFFSNKDYIFYLVKLRKVLEEYKATLFSYCLMSNHIHLEIKQDNDAPLSKVMGSLHASYADYFNKKYNRVGHLFQSRFKIKEVKSESQFIELVFYIHMNPVSAKLVKKPEDWLWSSAQDCIGLRNGTLCDKKIVGLLGLDVYKKIMKDKIETEKWKHLDGLFLD